MASDSLTVHTPFITTTTSTEKPTIYSMIALRSKEETTDDKLRIISEGHGLKRPSIQNREKLLQSLASLTIDQTKKEWRLAWCQKLDVSHKKSDTTDELMEKLIADRPDLFIVHPSTPRSGSLSDSSQHSSPILAPTSSTGLQDPLIQNPGPALNLSTRPQETATMASALNLPAPPHKSPVLASSTALHTLLQNPPALVSDQNVTQVSQPTTKRLTQLESENKSLHQKILVLESNKNTMMRENRELTAIATQYAEELEAAHLELKAREAKIHDFNDKVESLTNKLQEQSRKAHDAQQRTENLLKQRNTQTATIAPPSSSATTTSTVLANEQDSNSNIEHQTSSYPVLASASKSADQPSLYNRLTRLRHSSTQAKEKLTQVVEHRQVLLDLSSDLSLEADNTIKSLEDVESEKAILSTLLQQEVTRGKVEQLKSETAISDLSRRLARLPGMAFRYSHGSKNDTLPEEDYF